MKPLNMNTYRGIMVIALASIVVAMTYQVGFPQYGVDALESLEQRKDGFIERGGRTIYQSNSATMKCVHNISIAAQADGLISELLVDVGTVVKEGDKVLQIDDRVAKADQRVAEKELEAAVAQAAQEAEVEYAKIASKVADAEYNAENDLLEKGSSTVSQTRRKLLEAQRARLGIDVAIVKHQQEILAQSVAEAKLDARNVQADLYKVVAPYTGIIVDRKRDRGEWIRAGEPILQLLHMDEMKVDCNVSLGRFSPTDLKNAPIKLIVVSKDGTLEIDGQVDYVAPVIRSGRVNVSTKVKNQMVAGDWLFRDGMTVKVEITLP